MFTHNFMSPSIIDCHLIFYGTKKLVVFGTFSRSKLRVGTGCEVPGCPGMRLKRDGTWWLSLEGERLEKVRSGTGIEKARPGVGHEQARPGT